MLKSEHVNRARRMGFCQEDVRLICDFYLKGFSDGMVAHQSCLPPATLESNLILEFLVNGVPKYWQIADSEKKIESGGSKIIGLLARAYYDGFNRHFVERGVLSSESFPLQ